MLDVRETLVEDWKYVAEGGATVVLSYGGPDLRYIGTVLRLRKSSRRRRTPPTTSVVDAEDFGVEFHEHIVSRLVPKKFLPPRLERCIIAPPFEWIEAVAGLVENQRPASRRTEDGIDVSRCTGILATDLVGGASWAVEIKPKWGFLPSAAHLSPSTKAIKITHCRFCLRQHLHNTNYCPLDLYSGESNRMQYALQALWDLWVESKGETNNLRLFADGTLVDPSDAARMTTILSKKVSAALVGLHGLRDSFVSCLLPTLTSTNLLSTISCLHRTLDPLDIEGLETLWQKSRPNRSLGEGEANPNLEEWSSFVHEFLLNQARHQDSTTPRADKLRYYLLSALMSGTFKDCSIIIRFPPSPQTEPTATVIDLDTKNITKLNQWAEADRHIIEDWRHGERSSSERICVDSRAPCPEIGGIPS